MAPQGAGLKQVPLVLLRAGRSWCPGGALGSARARFWIVPGRILCTILSYFSICFERRDSILDCPGHDSGYHFEVFFKYVQSHLFGGNLGITC